METAGFRDVLGGICSGEAPWGQQDFGIVQQGPVLQRPCGGQQDLGMFQQGPVLQRPLWGIAGFRGVVAGICSG